MSLSHEALAPRRPSHSHARRFNLFLAALLVALLLLTRFGARCEQSRVIPMAATSASSAVPAGYLFNGRLPSPGMRLLYNFTWKNSTSSQFLPGEKVPSGASRGLSGEADFDGSFTLDFIGGTPAQAAIRFTRLEIRRWVILGRDLTENPSDLRAKLLDREAILVLQADGVLLDLRVDAGVGSLFRGLVQGLVGQLLTDVTTAGLPDGKGHSTLTRGPSGVAEANYMVAPGPELIREKVRYVEVFGLPAMTLVGLEQSLEARAVWGFQQEGVPYLHHANEQLRIESLEDAKTYEHRSSLLVTLGSMQGVGTQSAPRPLASTTSMPLHGAPIDADARRRMLERRTAGFGKDAAKMTILAAPAASNRAPKGFVFQAAGFVELYPEFADELATMGSQAGFPSRGRGLIMDILLSAGTPRAQAAMRQLLVSPSVLEDPRRPTFVNRFALVPVPDMETLAFLKLEYARTLAVVRESSGKDDETKRAARAAHLSTAYAFGSVIGRIVRGVDRVRGMELNQILVEALRGAETADQRHGYLLALGNATLPENAPLLISYASSDVAATRAHVADALGSTDTPESHATLLALAGDSDEGVASRALANLQDHTLRDGDADLVAAAVKRGRPTPVVVHAFLVYCNRRKPVSPALLETVRYLHIESQDEEQKARLRALEQRLVRALAPTP